MRLFLLLATLLLSQPAFAETAMLRIDSLPLDEAAAVAQGQLSDQGRIATLPSRNLLIIDDDAAHIAKVRALLKQLDTPPAQLNIRVAISEHETISRNELSDAAILPGGWVRIGVYSGAQSSELNNRYMLRVSSGSAGHIRAGEIRVATPKVRHYLSAHGIQIQRSVGMVDVTGGFDVQATLLANDRVRLVIHPWLRHIATDNVSKGPGNMREGKSPARIMLSEANTELTVGLGEKATLAASNSAASEFSYALLGLKAVDKHREVSITLSVTRASM